MNDEPNPYTPPQADPWPAVSDISYPDSGTLWRVVAGKLQVRHMASLPDIAIKGEPEGEPGRRMSMVIRIMPEWLYGVLWLGVAAVGLTGWLSDDMFIYLFLAAAFLPDFLGKKVRVMMFRTNAEMRRTTLWIVLFVALLIGLIFVAPFFETPELLLFWKGGTLSLIAFYFGVLHLIHHFKGGSLGWGRGREDGWFQVSGIAPAAIARLEELQQRMPPGMQERRVHHTP